MCLCTSMIHNTVKKQPVASPNKQHGAVTFHKQFRISVTRDAELGAQRWAFPFPFLPGFQKACLITTPSEPLFPLTRDEARGFETSNIYTTNAPLDCNGNALAVRLKESRDTKAKVVLKGYHCRFLSPCVRNFKYYST